MYQIPLYEVFIYFLVKKGVLDKNKQRYKLRQKSVISPKICPCSIRVQSLYPILCYRGIFVTGALYWPFYHHLVEKIGFNTVNPSLSTGKDYTVHSPMMNRMAILHRARSTDTMIITKTKTKAKCFQDPTCATFFKGLCV